MFRSRRNPLQNKKGWTFKFNFFIKKFLNQETRLLLYIVKCRSLHDSVQKLIQIYYIPFWRWFKLVQILDGLTMLCPIYVWFLYIKFTLTTKFGKAENFFQRCLTKKVWAKQKKNKFIFYNTRRGWPLKNLFHTKKKCLKASRERTEFKILSTDGARACWQIWDNWAW